jgi:hypothetical protein
VKEVRVRVTEVDGKDVAFVDLIERDKDKKMQNVRGLNNQGEWQEVPLYTPSPPETMLKVNIWRDTSSD